MSEDHETSPEKPSGADGEPAPSALNSAQSYIARSPGTSCPGCVGCKAFSLAFGALVEWAQAGGLIFHESDFDFLLRPPDCSGNEHEVWFDEGSNRWFKATYRNKFGLAWGRDGSATALEYIDRLVLQNIYFRDDIRLIGVIEVKQQIRVLTSQPHIAGDPACADEIQKWFRDLQFIRIESNGRIAWYREKENLLVADAHEGNVIKTASGALVPIDLNLNCPVGEMHKWLQSECRASGSA